MSTLRSVDPRDGVPFGAALDEATAAEIERAAAAAAQAFASEAPERTFSDAALLRAIADGIETEAPCLREHALRETGLAQARLDGELARTTGQLRAFAALVDSGGMLEPIIDNADPGAMPPRPDQRRLNVPIGPVAVFAASNFPFAFSVAGGDTASALAAGCPIVLKAHPGHPATSAATADVVAGALRDVGAPPAWFAVVQGSTPETGQLLAASDPIAAIAFTGSFTAGVALARAGALRARPIPVYAEMGAVNPLFITPRAAATRSAEIAEGLAASIAGSAGQLCTKPGVIALVEDGAGRDLADALDARLREVPAAPMLGCGLRDGFAQAIVHTLDDPRVTPRLAPAADERPGAWQAPVVAEAHARDLRADDPLLEEHFGPAAIVLWCGDETELLALARRLPGTLTATLHAEDDEPLGRALLPLLAAHAGRIVFNGYPTGVTIGQATVHGGPFPATTAAAHTSVGMTAVRRFLRPVGYQGLPSDLLPPALRDENPLGLVRLVDGVLQTP